jgi:hypothetical protein
VKGFPNFKNLAKKRRVFILPDLKKLKISRKKMLALRGRIRFLKKNHKKKI